MINCAESFRKAGVIPVIKIGDAAKAPQLAKALMAGGITAAEVTFRTPAAADAIHAMVQAEPEMYVCAGTVLTVADAERARQAGARAIISPGTSMALFSWCEANGLPYIPGVASATELMACLEKGVQFVKLFPAETVGGIEMLGALGAPFPTVQFMPTGGVNPGNVKSYLALPNVVACGGSWLVPGDALENGDFARIEALAKETSQMLRA